MSIWTARALVFVVAFVLFVPVRWHVWGGRLKDQRWRFLNLTFGQLVQHERANRAVSVAVWAAVLALLTWMAT